VSESVRPAVTSGPRYTLIKDGPAGEQIEFLDGFFPTLKAASYKIELEQRIGKAGSIASYAVQKPFTVAGPEFAIDASCISTVDPPDGSSDVYEQTLPSIVLTDAPLPWERSLVPGEDPPGPKDPRPWLALLLLRQDEFILDPKTGSPLTTTTVSAFLNESPDVLKPTLPDGWVAAGVLASQCQTITILGAAWSSLLPQSTELASLAHCRQLDIAAEVPALFSVIVSNRLPRADKAPVKYYAHLVSLEGFADYLGPNAQPIPPKRGAGQSGVQDVQLASLANWSFVSTPNAGPNFAQLTAGLIASQRASATLALPVATPSAIPPVVAQRLAQGFAALASRNRAGSQSFAWYRGPLSAVPPQPLPLVGDPPQPVAQAANSDALMIYLAEQGLFDLSYAAAWQLGRALGLADGAFAQALQKLRRAAGSAATLLAQRRSMPNLAGLSAAELLAHNPTQRRFSTLFAQGLHKRWSSALAAARSAKLAKLPVRKLHAHRAQPGMEALREVLGDPDSASAIAAAINPAIDPVAAWLARLSLLYPVPFSSLVPDARMLPAESLRFFYVDAGWLDALSAGALSIAIHGSADLMIQRAFWPALASAVSAQRAALFPGRRAARLGAESQVESTTPKSGLLIRSQLVANWPDLVVSGSASGAPLRIARRDRLAPDVLVCLFPGIPDSVSLAQPYKGLRYGVTDNGVALRNLTTPGSIGEQLDGEYIPASGGVAAFLLQYGSEAGVLDVRKLTADAAQRLGVTRLGPGGFAIQLMSAPELQYFPTRKGP
jgi:hypothetical protein